ncbi:MAG: glycosyltransferase family 4 protein, partial [Anaerolineae bacterium]|nr:glycosyltransferase family 4 protein [Anaerolineae bacterium]
MARIGLSIDDAVQQVTGVGQMMRMLIRGLVEAAPQHDYVLVYVDQGVTPAFVNAPNVRFCPIRLPRRFLHRGLWPLLNWPAVEVFTGPLDLFHVLTIDNCVPARCPALVTIHDLFPELYPQYHPATGRWFRQTLVAQMRRAPYLMTTSETVRREASEYLRYPLDRIFVTPLGLPDEYADIQPDHQVLERFRLDAGRYFLFVGRAHYRKNTDTLIKAFARFHTHDDDGMKLVIVGSASVTAGKIFEAIDTLGLQDAVLRPGYLPDAAVKGLLMHTRAFVYPSRHEGFGIPILESQHCGVPIIASTGGAIPEVAGDGALLVNPESAEALADAMQR